MFRTFETKGDGVTGWIIAGYLLAVLAVIGFVRGAAKLERDNEP